MRGCLLRNVSAALNPAGPLPMAMKPGATTFLGYHFSVIAAPVSGIGHTLASNGATRCLSSTAQPGIGASARGPTGRPRCAYQGARATAPQYGAPAQTRTT